MDLNILIKQVIDLDIDAVLKTVSRVRASGADQLEIIQAVNSALTEVGHLGSTLNIGVSEKREAKCITSCKLI